MIKKLNSFDLTFMLVVLVRGAASDFDIRTIFPIAM